MVEPNPLDQVEHEAVLDATRDTRSSLLEQCDPIDRCVRRVQRRGNGTAIHDDNDIAIEAHRAWGLWADGGARCGPSGWRVQPAGGGEEAAGLLGRARHRLRVDASGVRIGTVGGTRAVPWVDVVAFGRREDHHGRSGRVLGLVVGIDLLSYGFWWIAYAFTGRHAHAWAL